MFRRLIVIHQGKTANACRRDLLKPYLYLQTLRQHTSTQDWRVTSALLHAAGSAKQHLRRCSGDVSSRQSHLPQNWQTALSRLHDVKTLKVRYTSNVGEIAQQCEQFMEQHGINHETWDVQAQDRQGRFVDDIGQLAADDFPVIFTFKKSTMISESIRERVNERALSSELLASRIHPKANFLQDYEYTSDPPTSIGNGVNGEVVLCRRRGTHLQGATRCVKRFDISSLPYYKMGLLQNEAVIGLSLEHPNVARIYGIYEDADEISLVMQYCAGGTLSDALRREGTFSEQRFKEVSLQMLLAINYIHSRGIVHRDIKPRNWVCEVSGSVKLIDFGLGVIDSGDLMGYCGTLGYFAPEVVLAQLDPDIVYTAKVDIWSLGVVFFELVTGKPLFGEPGGRAPEDVLRDIREINGDTIGQSLLSAPAEARAFLRRLLEPDVEARPFAREALDDPYLASARSSLLYPQHALQPREVLERFRLHGMMSTPARAWSLAVARSPSQVPWEKYCALRDTFKMFDSISLNGTINLEAFLAIVAPSGDACGQEEARLIWGTVCGDAECLSYGEFLAALLPTMHDDFRDVSAAIYDGDVSSDLEGVMFGAAWDPALPVSHFLAHLPTRDLPPVFDESETVHHVLQAMSSARHRYAIVRFQDGRREFFDFMDVTHQLVNMTARSTPACRVSDAMAQLSTMAVGEIANCSGHSEFVPLSADASLNDVMVLITGQSRGQRSASTVRRVPITSPTGEILHILSCLSLLDLLVRFMKPIAALKALSGRSFDNRDEVKHAVVSHDSPIVDAFHNMNEAGMTVSFAASQDYSGGLGGVVSSGIISVADLRWVIKANDFKRLDQTVSEFMSWRANLVSIDEGEMLRRQQLGRFTVLSVETEASLHTLARLMLASQLNRIFLRSDKINRIVGIVSARDILQKILGQIMLKESLKS
eukprot:TRINITY_DN88230_c0_g1_i1.p1 TRINITY_DN88230_c0_g1~~TRINITY_DN88230_c0_g1_i1.p1  ORF type:complete len:934 (-),score=150.51 TRINITY_DN88230_c0_g1_i1:93-2894(-)